MLMNYSFSNKNSDSMVAINGKYNGYNILLVYDSVSLNCPQYGAWYALDGKSTLKSMEKYKLEDEFNLMAECVAPNQEYQFILDRTNSVRENSRISRFHIYTLYEYETIIAKQNEKKYEMEWRTAVVLVMMPISFILGVYIITNMPL